MPHQSTYQNKNKTPWTKGQNPFFQPKLSINQPNDEYEKEADAVSDHVMRKDNADAFFKPWPIQRQVIQRQEPDEEKEGVDFVPFPTGATGRWPNFGFTADITHTQLDFGDPRTRQLSLGLNYPGEPYFAIRTPDTAFKFGYDIANNYLYEGIRIGGFDFGLQLGTGDYAAQRPFGLHLGYGHAPLFNYGMRSALQFGNTPLPYAGSYVGEVGNTSDAFSNWEAGGTDFGSRFTSLIEGVSNFGSMTGDLFSVADEGKHNWGAGLNFGYDPALQWYVVAGVNFALGSREDKKKKLPEVQRKCAVCEEEENIQRKIMAEDVSAVVPVNMIQGGLNLIQRQESTRIDDTEIIHTEEEFRAIIEDDSWVAENDLEIQFPEYEIPVDDWRHQAILNYFRRGVQRLLQAIGNGLLWNWERWRGTDQITELRAGNVIVRTREERNEILRNYIQEINEWISFYEDLPIAFPYMGWDATPEHDFTSESYNPSSCTETNTLAWICSELLESHQIRNGSTILEATLLFSYLYHRPSFSFAPGETPRSYATGRELLIRQINEHTVAARYLSSAPIRDDEIILPENRDSNGRFFTWDGFRVYDNSEGWQDAYRGIEIATIMRKSMGNDNEELQRMSANGNEIQANGEIEKYVGNLNAGGSSLSPETNQFFSQKIGYDFSNVKIHTDNVAAKSAQSINALAYTTGNNIVFNQNQYQPNTDAGKKLLAHELTHVVQQNAFLQQKKVQRKRELTGEEAKKCLEKAETTTKALEDSLISRGEELPEYIKGAVKNLRSKLIEGKVKCYYFDGIVHGSVDYTKDEIQIDGGNLELINETILLHEAVHHYHGKQFPKAAKEYGENVGKEIDPNTTKGLNLLKWKAWTEYWAYRSGSDYYNPTSKQPMTDEEIHESVMRIDAVAKAVRNVWRYDNKFDVRKWKPVG